MVPPTKQEIIDKHWIEFMQFYRNLMAEAKKEELDMEGDTMSKMLEMISNPDKLQRTAVFEQFKQPNETTFWKWYALNKMQAEL